MVNITIVTGNAGTGKSYKLKEYIRKVNAKNKKFAVLCYTHSAVNNLKFPDFVGDNRFMTIHKYFRINFTTNTVMNYDFDKIDYIFIDEFSLISKQLFLTIFPIVCNTVNNLVMFGDYKQLSPIDTNETITFNIINDYINVMQIINATRLLALRTYNDSILSLPELQRNIKHVVVLEEIKRNDRNIIDLIDRLCFNTTVTTTVATTVTTNGSSICSICDDSAKNTSLQETTVASGNICSNSVSNEIFRQTTVVSNVIKSLLITKATLIDKIVKNNYIFIASKYKVIYEINKLIAYNNFVSNENYRQTTVATASSICGNYVYALPTIDLTTATATTATGKYKVFVKVGETVIFMENTQDFHNGDELIIKEITVGKSFKLLFYDIFNNSYKYYVGSYVPILPIYLTTYHKAQGRTIANAILCLDNLFAYQMLYTGISRCSNNVLFYINNDEDNEKIYEEIAKLPAIYNETVTAFNILFFNKFIDKN